MTRRAKSRRLTPRQNSERRASNGIEQLLIEILSQLASILVAVGYGISNLNALTRRAYFEAAKLHGARSTKKPSLAQIAAQTGLTRLEVSQLARESGHHDLRLVSPISRAHRVCIGWQTDGRYCTAAGEPAVLPFSGRLGSFSQLAKAYSRDIPARAMLLEMQRLRMVRVDRTGRLKLVRPEVRVPKHALATLRAIGPWIRFLSRETSQRLNATEQYQLKLRFTSAQQSMAAIRELTKRAKAFAKSVEQIGTNDTSPRGYELEVAIALAASLNPQLEKQTSKR
jgi:hypothetical protein